MFVIRFLIGLGVTYWKLTHPPPKAPPTVRFGKLPPPKFTVVARSSSGIAFTLKTVDGRPPETTAAGKVYAMPKKLPSLLAAERANKFAFKMGFTNAPDILSSTFYRYVDPTNSRRTLLLDIVNMNYQYKIDYAQEPEKYFTTNTLLTNERAQGDVKNFLIYHGLFDDTILKGIVVTTPLEYSLTSRNFTTASSLSTANAVRFDYFRNDLDKWKLVTPEFNKSYNYLIYTTARETPVIELAYTFWPIALDDVASYPLRSGEEAWKDLLDGYGYVVNLGNNSPENVIVRKISLAYYDSEEPQLYLQPIFVFEGDNGFAAYLPAIKSEWLE